jgi:hypothetical protein
MEPEMTTDRSKPTKVSTTRDSAAGRVERDADGNAVWRWRQSGALDSTTILLKRLENDALALEPTARLARPAAEGSGRPPRSDPAPPARGNSGSTRDGQARREARPADARTAARSGGGFDPYNKSSR